MTEPGIGEGGESSKTIYTVRFSDVGQALTLETSTKQSWEYTRNRLNGRGSTQEVDSAPFLLTENLKIGTIVEIPYPDEPRPRQFEVTKPSQSAINSGNIGEVKSSIYVKRVNLGQEELQKSGKVVAITDLPLAGISKEFVDKNSNTFSRK